MSSWIDTVPVSTRPPGPCKDAYDWQAARLGEPTEFTLLGSLYPDARAGAAPAVQGRGGHALGPQLPRASARRRSSRRPQRDRPLRVRGAAPASEALGVDGHARAAPRRSRRRWPGRSCPTTRGCPPILRYAIRLDPGACGRSTRDDVDRLRVSRASTTWTSSTSTTSSRTTTTSTGWPTAWACGPRSRRRRTPWRAVPG